MNKSPFSLEALPNGLRILTVPMDGVQSVAAMVWIRAGTRNETKEANGVAHFLEHMVFKGTKKYKNNLEISRTVEGVGGVLNAYTDSEFTSFWCKVPKDHLAKSLDLISQLVLFPELPESDIAKEAGNIVEEINRSEDRPEERGWDVFLELMYGNNPLGWRTLGSKETVSKIKRSDFEYFRTAHYSPDKMTIVVAGNVRQEEVGRQVREIFGGLAKYETSKLIPLAEKQIKPEVSVYSKKSAAQTHVYLGARAFPCGDKDNNALEVLNSVLGRGMSCRLWEEIREKQGIAYAIYSSTSLYSDAGVWATYAGLNTEKAEKGILGILDQMKRLNTERVGEKELNEAKERIRGPLIFTLENSFKLAEFYGMKAVVGEGLLGPQEEAERILAVTGEDVRRVAQRVFGNKGLNMAIVGPYNESEKERFAKILRLD